MPNIREKIDILRQQGVEIPAPETLEIGDEVRLDQIMGPGTVLHCGTKLYGEQLMILPGTRVGYEEPATLDGCAVGPGCQVNGGYVANAVLLDSVVLGKGSHVRGGTLMEEESNAAHTAGLKQAVLMPFVTLGSLINFCDVLMAGGTSRRDHSEVGSSFIHFNFTPFGRNGDKATPSLVGDVPRGVMLRSPRIFLGGQGGLVGPVHIDYGTVLAAGFVYRRDHGPDELVVGEKLLARTLPFSPLRYGRIRDRVGRNLRYIGNLVAMWHWYDRVRIPLFRDNAGRETLYRRAQQTIADGVGERIKRLGQVAGYMEDSIHELERDGAASAAEIRNQRALLDGWPTMERALLGYSGLCGDDAAYERLAQGLDWARGESYIEVIRSLDGETVEAGVAWLRGLVNAVEALGI
jgi:bifunctional UDP-N-acetylglucosamine pyrophosphorylase/glucosamine-1-phosphate N-acetyltransferase